TTTEPTVVIDYVDITTSAFTPGASLTSLNGTTDVTIVAAPVASTTRQVKYINIFNADTVAHTITVQHDDNGTERILWKGLISAGATLSWTPENGWVNTSLTGGLPVEFHGCLLTKSGDQSLSDSTYVPVTWDQEEYDTDA